MDERCHEYTIFFSTAIEPAESPIADVSLDKVNDENYSIIIDPESSLQRSIAASLQTNLSQYGSMLNSVVSLQQVATSAFLDRTFILSLVELEKPLLPSLNKQSFTALQSIIMRALGLLWVTGGGGEHNEEPGFHLIDGLARVAQTEFNKINLTTLALEPCYVGNGEQSAAQALHICEVLANISSQPDDHESEFIIRDGMVQIGRIVQNNVINKEIQEKLRLYQTKEQAFGQGPSLTLHVSSPGSLGSLQFRELQSVDHLAANEIEIEVRSTGVNFLDCLTALGQVDSKDIGAECAGVVTKVGSRCHFAPGDRVLCLATSTYQTYARTLEDCAAKVLDGLSLTEASALPVVFCTAWVALYDTARLQQGESVLIHAGAGGTGQAAIQIAQYIGAEIYVTVGSDKKKRLVIDTYRIPEDHIFFSRNGSIAQGIMRITQGRGVDVVLNSLAGERLRASWECVAPVSSLGSKQVTAA